MIIGLKPRLHIVHDNHLLEKLLCLVKKMEPIATLKSYPLFMGKAPTL
jgi:hypothetical protein